MFDFGSAHRNTISWSPHGRFLLLAGWSSHYMCFSARFAEWVGGVFWGVRVFLVRCAVIGCDGRELCRGWDSMAVMPSVMFFILFCVVALLLLLLLLFLLLWLFLLLLLLLLLLLSLFLLLLLFLFFVLFSFILWQMG